jgi:hypothetical protein
MSVLGMGDRTFQSLYRNQNNYVGSINHKDSVFKTYLNYTTQEGNSVSVNLTGEKICLLLGKGIDFRKITSIKTVSIGNTLAN